MDGAEFDLARARELVKQASYKGDPIPYRLLNDYYTNQTANAQVLTEMWREAGINVVIEMKENWTQIFDRAGQRGVHDWSNSAVFNDPIVVARLAARAARPAAADRRIRQCRGQRIVRQAHLEHRQGPRRKIFARLLEICEREDPAYTVLHQNATFTGKAKSIQWKAAPDFGMDFRSVNFAIN